MQNKKSDTLYSNSSEKFALVTGTLFCALSVGLGAFGAHALKNLWEPHRLENLHTAVHYLFLHGISLVILGHILSKFPEIIWLVFGIFAGTVLFSGSLIGWCVLQWQPLVFITPVGGTLLLASWTMLFIHFARKKRKAPL